MAQLAGAQTTGTDIPPGDADRWRDVDFEVRIAPVRSRIRLTQLPAMTPVITVLAVRDFKAKFKQSLLGPVWVVLQPTLLLVAFLVGFHSVAAVGTGGVPYVAFVLPALGAWTYFQSTLSMGAVCLLSNVQLLRRTACPRLAFAISALIANLPALLVPTVAAIAVSAVLGDLSADILILPIAVLWLVLVTAGTITIASALTVRYRDLVSALPIVLQMGVFVTPVGYLTSDLPGITRTIVELNPLTGVIGVWRWAILSMSPPSLATTGLSAAITVLLVVIGWLVFTRSEPTMADVV